MRQLALSLTLALLIALPAAAELPDDGGWEHARTAEGVEVYTRAVPGSAFKEFRATGVVPAPLSQVVSWWRDPSTFTAWIDSCMEARRVDAGEGVKASYLVFDFPFPASNRDVVLRVVEVEATRERAVMESRSTEGLVPEVDGLVRIAKMHGRWEFSAEGENSTRVVYRQHMDAGGSLPAFILNRAVVDNPIGTLSGLARYAESQRGR